MKLTIAIYSMLGLNRKIYLMLVAWNKCSINVNDYHFHMLERKKNWVYIWNYVMYPYEPITQLQQWKTYGQTLFHLNLHPLPPLYYLEANPRHHFSSLNCSTCLYKRWGFFYNITLNHYPTPKVVIILTIKYVFQIVYLNYQIVLWILCGGFPPVYLNHDLIRLVDM